MEGAAKAYSESAGKNIQNSLDLWYGSVNLNGLEAAPIDVSIASKDRGKTEREKKKHTIECISSNSYSL